MQDFKSEAKPGGSKTSYTYYKLYVYNNDNENITLSTLNFS